ncbi:MAG: enoyl-CoA hydratase-related protein [Pseudomonadota bacterium]
MADEKAGESGEPTVLYDVDGAVARVTLNRPHALNAFTGPMRAELRSTLMRAASDEAVRAVVLTGAGRGFSSGADLTEVQGSERIEDILNTEYSACIQVIATMEKPVIAAVTGAAAGVGGSFALACDLLVIAEDGYLLAPFSNISLVPDGGFTWLLTRQIGYRLAYELAIEAKKIDANRCLELGLANRIAPSGAAADEATAWARSLAERAPLSLAATKRAMRSAMTSSLTEASAYEASMQGRLLASKDFREGVGAFLEKRPAKYTGR